MKPWLAFLGKARASASPDIAVSCPLCQASVDPAPEVTIEWDEDKKCFAVQRQATCVPCHHAFPVIVKTVPLVLVQDPTCACGSRFFLARHQWQKTQDDLAFEATYICPACSRQKRAVVGKLKRGMATRWRDTEHIAIGPTGVQYAQAPATEDERSS
jgi:hypothetical protein